MSCACGRPGMPCCGYVHTWQSFNNEEGRCPHCLMAKAAFTETKTPDRIRVNTKR